MKHKSAIISFLLKGVAVLLSLFLFLFGMVMPRFTTTYNAAILDKFARLTALEGPKVVLVGGSSVAVGVDSIALEDALGLPVVNFGLHAGLGAAFTTDMVEDHIGPGDIVVVLPESYDDESALISDCVLAWLTVENHTQLWAGIDPRNLPGMVSAFPSYIRRALDLWLINSGYGDYGDIMYNRRMFNSHGDNTFPRPETLISPDYDEAYFSSQHLSPALEKYWNGYAEALRQKGAQLYMGCPPILQHTLAVDLDALQAELEEKLGFPVISTLSDYVYPYTDYFDTGYHLNDAGVKKRTAQLIKDLQNAVP